MSRLLTKEFQSHALSRNPRLDELGADTRSLSNSENRLVAKPALTCPRQCHPASDQHRDMIATAPGFVRSVSDSADYSSFVSELV